MRGGHFGVLALAFLLAASAPALAETGRFDLDAALPLVAEGAHAARSDQAALHLQGDAGQAHLMAQGLTGTAERVIHRAFGYVNTMDPSLALTWDDHVERVELPLEGATLQLEARRPEFQALAFDGAATLSGTAPLGIGALAADQPVTYALDPAISVHLAPPDASDAFSHVVPAGTFQARSMGGHAILDAPFTLFIHGAVATYVDPAGSAEALPVHFREETRPGLLYNPLSGTWSGPGEHTEYVQEYVLLHVTSGRLDLLYDAVPATLYAAAPQVDLVGTLQVPDASGHVVVDGKDGATHRLDGRDLTLGGHIQLQAAPAATGPARTHVTGSGDITQVTYGHVAATYDWATLAAVGAGAVLLAALAWALANGKALLASAGAILGYARVQGDEILQHPGRSEVYDRVKAQPGVSFVDLQAQCPFGASTLTYHLRVLEKNGFVTSQKDGRYVRFFDRRSGLYAANRKVAVSALRNPNTAAIAQAIVQNPGVAQRDLAQRFAVSASTVSWHIQRLHEAGLVERQKDAHFTRYYAGQAWATLPAEEQARFGHAAQAPVLAVA